MISQNDITILKKFIANTIVYKIRKKQDKILLMKK